MENVKLFEKLPTCWKPPKVIWTDSHVRKCLYIIRIFWHLSWGFQSSSRILASLIQSVLGDNNPKIMTGMGPQAIDCYVYPKCLSGNYSGQRKFFPLERMNQKLTLENLIWFPCTMLLQQHRCQCVPLDISALEQTAPCQLHPQTEHHYLPTSKKRTLNKLPKRDRLTLPDRVIRFCPNTPQKVCN